MKSFNHNNDWYVSNTWILNMMVDKYAAQLHDRCLDEKYVGKRVNGHLPGNNRV